MYKFGIENCLKNTLMAFISLTLYSTPSVAATQHSEKEVIHQIDAFVKQEVQKRKIPGCAIAIIQQGKVAFLKGYGHRNIQQAQALITPDTVFQLGSVSKPIAATLAMRLEKEGLLKIQDPINQYMDFSPKFPKQRKACKAAYYHPMRLRHALSHTTGIGRAGFNQLIEQLQPWPKIKSALENTPNKKSLGHSYEYNNASYELVGKAISLAAHHSFQNTLQIYLTRPLGMTHTTASLAGLLQYPNRAYPHVRGKKGGLIPVSQYSQGYYTVPAAGGINSTARDMATFIQAQLGECPEFLPRSMLARLHHPEVSTPDVLGWYSKDRDCVKSAHYGLGWRILNFRHHKLVFHGGWLKGFTNFVGFIPDQGLGIVVLHNSENKFASRLGMKFFDLSLGASKTKNW
ncbi:MAG: serine hydrolase domain-containing protein [Gammaproteobacteria bacterium]